MSEYVDANVGAADQLLASYCDRTLQVAVRINHQLQKAGGSESFVIGFLRHVQDIGAFDLQLQEGSRRKALAVIENVMVPFVRELRQSGVSKGLPVSVAEALAIGQFKLRFRLATELVPGSWNFICDDDDEDDGE